MSDGARPSLGLDRMGSPIGTLLLVHDTRTGALRALDYLPYEARLRRLLRLHYGDGALRPAPAPAAMRAALYGYFDGALVSLASLEVRTGGTSFQRAVWARLRRIGAGETTTYGRLAVELGRPGASRAVGAANGANPVAIVVPCHRVVGADGRLTGYAGGLGRKRWLLAHEARCLGRSQTSAAAQASRIVSVSRPYSA